MVGRGGVLQALRCVMHGGAPRRPGAVGRVCHRPLGQLALAELMDQLPEPRIRRAVGFHGKAGEGFLLPAPPYKKERPVGVRLAGQLKREKRDRQAEPFHALVRLSIQEPDHARLEHL